MLKEQRWSGRKANAWISDDLYSKVDDLKYRTLTEAIVSGLELLVKSTKSGQGKYKSEMVKYKKIPKPKINGNPFE